MDITEQLTKAASVPKNLWEFEDLMKGAGEFKNMKYTEVEELEHEHKKRLHRENKRVFNRFKKKDK